MTDIKRSIEILRTNRDGLHEDIQEYDYTEIELEKIEEVILTLESAIAALEKQVEKRAIKVDLGRLEGCKCRNCNEMLSFAYKYCQNCGQKLDWSGEND